MSLNYSQTWSNCGKLHYLSQIISQLYEGWFGRVKFVWQTLKAWFNLNLYLSSKQLEVELFSRSEIRLYLIWYFCQRIPWHGISNFFCNFQKHLFMRQSVFWSTVTVLGYLNKQDNNNTVVAAWNLFDEDGFNLITRLPVTPGDV